MKKYLFPLFLGTVVLMNCSVFKKSSGSGSSSSSKSEVKQEEVDYHHMNQEQQLAEVSRLTDQQYSNGMTMYEAKCGTCHDLPKADSRDVGAWLRIMQSMSVKATLTNDEEKQIMGYLYTNCKK